MFGVSSPPSLGFGQSAGNGFSSPIGVSWEFESPILTALASLVGLIGARVFWFAGVCRGISG